MDEIEKSCWPVTFRALALFGGILAAGALMNVQAPDQVADTMQATQVSAAPSDVVTD